MARGEPTKTFQVLACATPEQREQSPSKLIKMVDALRSGRMHIVTNNAYYYPLQLHDDIEKVIYTRCAREGICWGGAQAEDVIHLPGARPFVQHIDAGVIS